MKRILIIGANSAMARACARLWAAQGHRLHLVARQQEPLAAHAADLLVRGAAAVSHAVLDANDMDRHDAALDTAVAALGGLDTVLIAYGTLSDQSACEQDVALTLRELQTNGLTVIALATRLANRLEAQGSGTLAVIGSVAGDRGRQSNYVYGTAKGMVAIYLQGLRQRLYKTGVRVVTIKPGFVDTPMTQAFRKGPLWASPQTVSRGIVSAIERGTDVVYVPGFWRLIMVLIRSVPEALFKRLKL